MCSFTAAKGDYPLAVSGELCPGDDGPVFRGESDKSGAFLLPPQVQLGESATDFAAADELPVRMHGHCRNLSPVELIELLG